MAGLPFFTGAALASSHAACNLSLLPRLLCEPVAWRPTIKASLGVRKFTPPATTKHMLQLILHNPSNCESQRLHHFGYEIRRVIQSLPSFTRAEITQKTQPSGCEQADDAHSKFAAGTGTQFLRFTGNLIPARNALQVKNKANGPRPSDPPGSILIDCKLFYKSPAGNISSARRESREAVPTPESHRSTVPGHLTQENDQ
ncbi:hypothetical protein Emed_007453 [Eimeria media]